MSKVYYITSADPAKPRTPLGVITYADCFPGVQCRHATEEEQAQIPKFPKENAPEERAIIFERRAQARRAVQLLGPGYHQQIHELGSTTRNCTRKVLGWLIVYTNREYNGEPNISAFNPYSESNGYSVEGVGYEVTEDRVYVDRSGEEYDGYLVLRREDARAIIHSIMADEEGRLPKRSEREYSIEPVYA